MTSSNGNIFRVTGHSCGEFTGHQWIPSTKASDAELWCLLWSAPEMHSWVNNSGAGDLKRHRDYRDVTVIRSHYRSQCWEILRIWMTLNTASGDYSLISNWNKVSKYLYWYSQSDRHWDSMTRHLSSMQKFVIFGSIPHVGLIYVIKTGICHSHHSQFTRCQVLSWL